MTETEGFERELRSLSVEQVIERYERSRGTRRDARTIAVERDLCDRLRARPKNAEPIDHLGFRWGWSRASNWFERVPIPGTLPATDGRASNRRLGRAVDLRASPIRDRK